MSTLCQPVVSDVADLYFWKSAQEIASNSPVNGANQRSAQIKLLPNACFVFVAWRGNTNYDAGVELRAEVGAGPAAASAIYPAVVPNNFKAFVKRNNRFNMMDKPCPQGVLCSTGYRAGQQVPIPIVYPPATTFNITLYNTAPTIFTLADQTTPIPLKIQFGLFGYNVPLEKLNVFLKSWPEYYAAALSELTKITVT